MPRTVLVAGASGFVGSSLCRALVRDGHDVRAMTRRPEEYDGAGTAVGADVSDPAVAEDGAAAGDLARAMDGVDVAYYLVHSLGSDDFEDEDAEAARRFGEHAAAAGVDQIVYLGGLGRDDEVLSPHLRSRREVEQLLGEAGVTVTTLRAAVVVGHGGVSWEITRQLVENLPVMITPSWVQTRTQPIALPDVVRYLVDVMDEPRARGRVLEVGGPEAMPYLEMLGRAAKVMGRRRLHLGVPLLSPAMSARWLSLVTDVGAAMARNLVDSMTTEMVVDDDCVRELLPGTLMSYEDSVRVALADRARAEGGAEDDRDPDGHLGRDPATSPTTGPRSR